MLALVLFLFSVGMGSLGAQTGTIRLLKPRVDSPTAMRRCGVVLEDMKAEKNLTRQYVFTGEEVLTGMHYCAEGQHPLVDDRNSYRVPAGTVGWLSDDGKSVVLEECVNEAVCEGCPPTPPPPPPPRIEIVELHISEGIALVELNDMPAPAALILPGPLSDLTLPQHRKRDWVKYVPCVGLAAKRTKGRAVYCVVVAGAVVGGYFALAGHGAAAVLKPAPGTLPGGGTHTPRLPGISARPGLTFRDLLIPARS